MKKQSYNTGNGEETAKVSAKDIKYIVASRPRKPGPARFLGMRRKKRAGLPALVEAGLSAKAPNYLADNLGIPVDEFTARYARIPKQSVIRRRNSGKLNIDESDKMMRYAVLLDHTVDMMNGNQDAAKRWLNSPRPLLDNKTPLEHARTEAGASEVHRLIGRIETGTYS